MKKLIITLSLISASLVATPQDGYAPILQQIEANNTTLAALRQQTEADKLANRTGLTPSNPEVEFNYLWGSPSIIGNRTDISFRQTFDFPSAYTHRTKIATLQNANADLAYKAERLTILLSARQTCIELAYYNALLNEYTVRLQNAERIAEAYKTKLDNGETTILEYNKALLNLTTVQAEVAQMEIEMRHAMSQLRQLNGRKDIVFSVADPPLSLLERGLPADFEAWYLTAESKNPVLLYVRTQIEIGQQHEKLNHAMGLPKLLAGYMSEKVVGEHYQGVTVGMSIPLWENKNRIKQAKAQTLASQAMFEDSKVQFYNRLQALYFKAAALLQNAQRLRLSIGENNNEPLLKQALDAGEISLLTYLLEVEYYYNAINKVLEAERDYELTASELWAVEM